MSVITVSGERQAGKSHTLLSVVGVSAMRGENAIWFADGLHVADIRARDLADLFGPVVYRSVRTNGSYHVEMVGGGRVYFRSAGQRNPISVGMSHTAFVFDDVPVPAGVLREFPSARIYTTETVGPAASPGQRLAALARAAREYAHGEEACPDPRGGDSCVFAGCPVHNPRRRTTVDGYPVGATIDQINYEEP